MKKGWKHGVFMLCLIAVTSPDGFSATIKGTVKFEGTPPSPKKLDISADPRCALAQKTPLYSEAFVFGPGQSLANVFVKIKSGVPAQTYPVPQEPVVLDQRGCHYVPHVIGALKGQTVKILNSDGTLHNVHSFSKVNPAFNMAMPASIKVKEKVLSKAEGMFNVKCDIHPWMEAWVGVVDHPFFAVSKEDGTYLITGVPAGTYELEAWHEKAGTKTAQITVTAEESKVQGFAFSSPK